MDKQPTVVFDTWDRLYVVMLDTFPESSDVAVLFGDVADAPDEAVALPGVSNSPPSREWATYGNPGQQEQFALQVMFRAAKPGQSRAEALTRLRDMVCAAINALRDPATGLPIGGFAAATSGAVLHHIVSGVNPRVFPIGNEGHAGYCELDVLFKARI